MNAGDIKHLLSFVYADQTSVPITSAATQTYLPGIMSGKMFSGTFNKRVQVTPHWNADNADPMDIEFGKIPIEGYTAFKCALLDDVPLFLGLGKHTADTPTAGISQVESTPDGSVPCINWHAEHNYLPFEQAKDYANCYCINAKLMTMALTTLDGKDAGNCLGLDMKFIAQREYNMTDDSVARLTTAPIYRGTEAREMPCGLFKIKGNTGLTLTWNGKNLGKHLVDVSVEWNNAWSPILLGDNLDYAGLMMNEGQRVFKNVILKFNEIMSADDDVAHLEQYLNRTTSSDMVLTVPSSKSNERMVITLKNCYLVSVTKDPAPPESTAVKYITLEFSFPKGDSTHQAMYVNTTMDEQNAAVDYDQ